MADKTYRVGVVGYGGAFNMGRQHLTSLLKHPGFVAAAVCDPDVARHAVAKSDFPGIETYTTIDDMLAKAHLNLAIIITPHNTHAELVIKCLKQGVGAVCEKPLAISTQEVDEMIAASQGGKIFFSTFHNRRWDGDYLVLKKLVAENLIGRIFRIDCGMYNYHKQRDWWRSIRKISGGNIYDWGAHFTDWVLGIVPGQVRDVIGYQVKNPAWTGYDNEDHSEYLLRFEQGTQVNLTISNMTAAWRPWWTIYGEKGSLVHSWDKKAWEVKVFEHGRMFQTDVKFEDQQSDGFYANVAGHLTKGEPLAVTPESAARVIAVLDSANQSAARDGMPVVPKYR